MSGNALLSSALPLLGALGATVLIVLLTAILSEMNVEAKPVRVRARHRPF
jgi:hypothetical protein